MRSSAEYMCTCEWCRWYGTWPWSLLARVHGHVLSGLTSIIIRISISNRTCWVFLFWKIFGYLPNIFQNKKTASPIRNADSYNYYTRKALIGRDHREHWPTKIKVKYPVSDITHTHTYTPLNFNPLPRSPRERIFTEFGTNVHLVDVINPDKLSVNLFKGFDFTGGQISIFPIGNWRRRYNSAALPRSLWYLYFTINMVAQIINNKCKTNCSLSTTYNGEMTHRIPEK